MIQFQCDYSEGAHPRLLERIVATNEEQTIGYGEDSYCTHARELIKSACQCPQAQIHFLVGGTQTNTTVIAHLLRPYQGVVAADTGHVNVHETGAIENTGHKVLALPSTEGKISAEQVVRLMEDHRNDCSFEHMVQPGMVYISYPTEVGTLYSHQELRELHAACRRYQIPLYIDGARLGYGLCSPECDLTLPDLAQCCDVFYIGGTKVGALFGEAVVFTAPSLSCNFRYSIKQHGGMLAKGRLLGLQFETLFADGLYFKIAGHAVHEALRIKAALQSLGVPFLVESSTNQQFPIFPNTILEQLQQHFQFSFWERVDDRHTAVRICTCWATQPQNVDQLISVINQQFLHYHG